MSSSALGRSWRFPASGLARRGGRFHTTSEPHCRNSSVRGGLNSRSPFIASTNGCILLSVRFRTSTLTGNYRTSLVARVRRQYSVLSRPPENCLEIGIPSRRNVFLRPFHVSSALCYDRLQSLEDAANRDRDNANVQAIFLQVR